MTQKPPAVSWEALSRPAAPQPDAAPPRNTPEEMVMRALSGPAGRDFLQWLHKTYVEKSPRPQASDAELREDAACRRLVLDLERMNERGSEIAASRSKQS